MVANRLPRTFAIAFTASLTLLSLVAAPAAAYADTCLYNPTPGGLAPVSGGGAVPGPWTGTIGPTTVKGCPMGGYSSSAATCTGYGVGVTGAYCDTGFTPAAPTTPLHTICTVYPSPGVTLKNVAAGWDLGGAPFPGAIPPPYGMLGGPAAPPDGNLDGWDLIGSRSGVAFTTTAGPAGEMTVHVYPPMFPSGTTTYQLIVFMGATSALPGGLGAPLTAACQ